MLYIATFATWIIAIFTNIYISKLLYGKNYCMIDGLNSFKTLAFVLFAPFVSIVLFITYVFRQSCEFSNFLITLKKKSCLDCVHCKYKKCTIYDLNVRDNMLLCKGSFYKSGIRILEMASLQEKEKQSL